MKIHIDHNNTEKILFERLNKRTREFVKRSSKVVTAQELIDQA